MLLALLAALEWFAEYWLPLALLIFVPPYLLCVTSITLATLSLIRRRWRLITANLVCAGLVPTVFMVPRVHTSPRQAGEQFSVITHNIGQGNRSAFVDSFPDENPDVVLLQDVFFANRRERDYMRRYPGYHTRGLGQFMLLTPHEIESASLVREALWRGQPVAARFVLRAKGCSVAVYCVHMPTPRDPLSDAISHRVLLEMLGLRDAPTGRFPSYRSWNSARLNVARQLALVFDQEPLPFIVGGDFNTPDHGVIYRLLTKRLVDAHVAAGRGYGFTFPGSGDGRLSSIIGHWLRLDYLFAGRGWKPVFCRVGEDCKSQHRAVLARFVRLP